MFKEKDAIQYQFYKVEKLPRTTQDHLELVFSGTSSSFTILELSSTGPGSNSVQKGQKTGTVLNFQTLLILSRFCLINVYLILLNFCCKSNKEWLSQD